METIDKAVLEEKLKATGDAFEKIDAEIRGIDEQMQTLAKQKSNRQVEQFRLQGQHRLLKELLPEKKEETN